MKDHPVRKLETFSVGKYSDKIPRFKEYRRSGNLAVVRRMAVGLRDSSIEGTGVNPCEHNEAY